MMNNWIMAKAKFGQENERGELKMVVQPYLMDALSYAEAEGRLYEELKDEVKGEVLCLSVSKTNVREVFDYEDSTYWWKAKVTYFLDTDSGTDKKVANNFLVNAENIEQATERMKNSLQGMMVTWQIEKLELTTIAEVWHYAKPEAEATAETEVNND